MSESKKVQCENIHTVIEDSVPADKKADVLRILYGPPCDPIPLTPECEQKSKQYDFEVRAFKMSPAKDEEKRPHRFVRVAAVQNKIVLPTNAPISSQYKKLEEQIQRIIEAASSMNVNILCLQEAWTCPFFFCTREKHPWLEFSESAEDGQSIQFIQKMALKYKMVIIAPILERDQHHQGQIWNTAVVIGDHGNIIGKHRKNHIPRVGDFNESTYYFEGNTGHPVFETRYGKIAVNICYGRHFPQNWRMFALNGAEIVFNPSATVDSLSESLWSIEARAAAVFNNYYSVAINRVGTETFPNEFTSGDGKPAHHDFGHFYGSSYITGPTSQRTPPCSRTRDSLLIAEIDLNLIQQVRDSWLIQSASRNDLYAESYNKQCELYYNPPVITDPCLQKPDK